MTPTEKALAYLRDIGMHADRVECSNGRFSRDYLGIIDVIAFDKDGTVAVQVTSNSNMAARRKKMKASENLAHMLACGWSVWLMGFKKGSSKPKVEAME